MAAAFALVACAHAAEWNPPQLREEDPLGTDGPATGSKDKAGVPRPQPAPTNGGEAPAGPAGALLSLLEPTSAQVATRPTSVPVTITGMGFTPGMTVDVDGTRVAAKVTSATTLTATIPQEKLVAAGVLAISVVSAPPATSVSNALAFTVTSATAVVLVGLDPPSAEVRSGDGDRPMELTVTGSGFTPASIVLFNGTGVQTVFRSETALLGRVGAGLLTSPGQRSVTVRSENGSMSVPLKFEVTAAPSTGGTTGGSTGGSSSSVTCAEAGVSGNGCVASGPYAGALCSNGYLYQDAQCAALYGNGGASSGGSSGGSNGGQQCQGATCASFGMSPGQCGQSPQYGVIQCGPDGCMYQGCGP